MHRLQQQKKSNIFMTDILSFETLIFVDNLRFRALITKGGLVLF